MSQHSVVPAQRPGKIVPLPVARNTSLDQFKPLQRFDHQAEMRPDHIACVSAGWKDDGGIPHVSRDGTLYVSDPEERAPGLAEILKANGRKRLMVAMPSNDINECVGQSYRLEGRKYLEAYGDERGITVISAEGEGKHTFHPAGSPEFERLKKICKVSTNISFMLVEYDENGLPRIIFPDGLGVYRIRTTSPTSLDNLRTQLGMIARLTGGHIAGIPLDCRLAYRNKCGPKGDKRNVPVFVFTLMPPNGLSLDSRTFRPIAEQARIEISAANLALPAPEPGLATAIDEWEPLEPAMDEALWRRAWFGTVRGTDLDSDEARAEFIGRFTEGRTTSLRAFLETASYREAQALIAAAEAQVGIRLAPTVDRETGEVIEAEAIAVTAPDPDSPSTPEQHEAIAAEMTRAGWGPAAGRGYLRQFGKRSRSELTHGEAVQFIAYLATQPTCDQGEEV